MNKASRIYKQNAKRIAMIAVLAVTLVLCVFFAVACNYINPSLVRITAEYKGGEVEVDGTLNEKDVVVTAYFSDKKSSIVRPAAFNYDFSKAGLREVEVTYGYHGKDAACKFYVTVVEKYVEPDPTLERVGATYNGASIKVGGALDNADIAVTAYYSNDTSKAVTNFAVGGFSSATAGTCVVTVSYTDGEITKECTVDITVIEAVVEVANYGKYGIMQDNGSVKITNTAIVNDELQIHFLAVTNNSPGDSVYIKAGTGENAVDILIDAGSTTAAATSVPKYLSDNNLVTDDKFEYLIATHSDSDHISGLAGSGDNNGILDKFSFGTIITYSGYYTDAKGTKSAVQTRFENKCKALAENGVNVFTDAECYNNAKDGAQRVYKLTDNIEMQVLNNPYYLTKGSNNNNYSVCVMVNQYGDGYDFDNPSNPDNVNYVNHFLFTGDLENKTGSGESNLVANNNLPNVVLFKGAHHGSETSSNIVLMDKINPKLVCVCTCCGETHYGFPAQEFIDRTAKYTDMVFMTNQNVSGNSYTHLNGNIVVTSNSNGVFVKCSNNNTLFKDTDWFKNNRTCPPEWKDEHTSD